MRNVFCCVICGVHYLPPEGMVYPETGITASPAHCARPECTAKAAGGVGGVPLRVLEQMAMRAATDPEAAGRRVERARGRRAAAAPGGGRSKLK